MVISADGYFYSYNIDLENGGECSLLKQYRYVYGYEGLTRNVKVLFYTQFVGFCRGVGWFSRLRRGLYTRFLFYGSIRPEGTMKAIAMLNNK